MQTLAIVLALLLILETGIAIGLFFSLLGRLERAEEDVKNIGTAISKAPVAKTIEGTLTVHHQLQTAALPAKFEITKRKY